MSTAEHVAPAELDRYLNGSLDRIEAGRVREHCLRCDQCLQQFRLRFWAQLLSGLPVATGYRQSGGCLSGATLERHAEGELTEDERLLVEQHLAGCRTCRLELAVCKHEAHRNTATKAKLSLPPGQVHTYPETVCPAGYTLAAAGDSAAAKPARPTIEDKGREGLRYLGRIAIREEQYELWTDSAGVFLTPRPGKEFRFLLLDGRRYPLQVDERRPEFSLIQGLAEDEIREVLDDLQHDPDAHTFDLLP